jgi:hypothetical protein
MTSTRRSVHLNAVRSEDGPGRRKQAHRWFRPPVRSRTELHHPLSLRGSMTQPGRSWAKTTQRLRRKPRRGRRTVVSWSGRLNHSGHPCQMISGSGILAASTVAWPLNETLQVAAELRSFAEITNRRVPPAYAQAVWISTRPGVLQPYFPRFKRHIRVHHQEESRLPPGSDYPFACGFLERRKIPTLGE